MIGFAVINVTPDGSELKDPGVLEYFGRSRCSIAVGIGFVFLISFYKLFNSIISDHYFNKYSGGGIFTYAFIYRFLLIRVRCGYKFSYYKKNYILTITY